MRLCTEGFEGIVCGSGEIFYGDEAVTLYFLHYSFRRIHSTLRVTPAMQAGISDHVWSIGELCDLLPKAESANRAIEKSMILKALS
jgi:hypothetical protein